LVDDALSTNLEKFCQKLSLPSASILNPVLEVFQSYLGLPTSRKIGAQHVLDKDYFRRIDAMNFTMAHDDGVLPDDLDDADIILLGISRTSKTPTSIYLANRGFKTANIPLIPSIEFPEKLTTTKKPLMVGLTATIDRIAHIRENRILALNASGADENYVDRANIAEEIAYSRKLCMKYGWPLIDVTRRSIEETATKIIALHREKQQKQFL
jgi:regulator of PEP synthase PpsR (kinase-PPPase family)